MSQRKYNRKIDFSISKTGAKPSSLDIFFKFYQVENLEKARKMEKREKNISGHPQKKKTIRQ